MTVAHVDGERTAPKVLNPTLPIMSASNAPSRSSGGPMNLAIGAVIQMVEAATLGMPFEVWKTRCARFRNESTLQALGNVYKTGGGISAFWNGVGPKMVESASKGAVLLYAKDAANVSLLSVGMAPTSAGLCAGAIGGIAQTVVISPMTFLVTGSVTGDQKMSTIDRVRKTYSNQGIKGFYAGGTAVALRQATNWASRQGFTEGVRQQIKIQKYGDPNHKLTKFEEIISGIAGGTLSCWNHIFETCRVEQQARADQGQPKMGMFQVMRMVVKEHGFLGLYRGVFPRILLGSYQTLFMVVFARMAKEELFERGYLS